MAFYNFFFLLKFEKLELSPQNFRYDVLHLLHSVACMYLEQIVDPFEHAEPTKSRKYHQTLSSWGLKFVILP